MERQPTDQDPIPFSFLNMSDASWTPPAQQASHAPFLASVSPNVRLKLCIKLTSEQKDILMKSHALAMSSHW